MDTGSWIFFNKKLILDYYFCRFELENMSIYEILPAFDLAQSVGCVYTPLRTSKVHSGHDAVILIWHRTCIWLQYIIFIELSKLCADNLNDLGVMKDFLISLWHAAHYSTGWLIDHGWNSNKQITIISWPSKLHHKMDFYIFYLINKLVITKTGTHCIHSK